MEIEVYGNYQEYKAALDKELKEASEGFVRIGYLLRQALETDILEGSGYANVNEFAKAEYNLDKTQVSRFININMRFSEGGNSQYLKEQYRGIGYAKLALMLQLPDEINAELTPGYSKSEIQAIKEEVDEEKKITDLEVLMEGQKEEQAVLENNLQKVVHQLGEDEPELYVRLYECAMAAGPEKLKEILAPDGEKIYIVRIRGFGRKMLSLKETEGTVTLTDIRSGEKELHTWEALFESVRGLMREGLSAADSWESVYKQEFPLKKEEVAPVQQPGREAPAPRREKKVQKAKVKKREKAEDTAHEQKKTKEDGSGEALGEPERENDINILEQTEDYCIERRGGKESGYHGEPVQQDTGSGIAANGMELALRDEAEELAGALRQMFRDWDGQELPVEGLLAAKRNAEKLLAVIAELLRRKTETRQMDGQMSLGDIMDAE